MKVTRYTRDEIKAILGEACAGDADDFVCLRYGISPLTLRRWRAKYGGDDQDIRTLDATGIAELHAENARLKRLVAKHAADLARLRSVLARRT